MQEALPWHHSRCSYSSDMDMRSYSYLLSSSYHIKINIV
jgi:hypothetical protein